MNTKYTSIFTVVSLAISFMSHAQVKTNNTINATIGGESVYLDASSFPATNNLGKGLSVPRTNLTTFTFVTQVTNGLKFPTAYDGMIVYNSVAGTTPASGSGIGGQSVSVGFYYFSNPTPTPSFSSASGQWLPLGQSPKFNVVNNAAAGVATNTQVDGVPVYAYKGQFTTTGSSTSITLAVPTGLTSMYGITIFKKASTGNKVVFAKELYSYDSTSGAAVTGSQNMSVVYPADTYDYIIEYFK